MHHAQHLPHEQPIYFSERNNPALLHQRMDSTLTPLYVYTSKAGWKPRMQRMSIGHIYTATPFMGERYYLRILLTVVRGATSFEHQRTVDGIFHPTFMSACIALRMLEDDGE